MENKNNAAVANITRGELESMCCALEQIYDGLDRTVYSMPKDEIFKSTKLFTDKENAANWVSENYDLLSGVNTISRIILKSVADYLIDEDFNK